MQDDPHYALMSFRPGWVFAGGAFLG